MSSKPSFWTDARMLDVLDRIDRGETYDTIAEAFGVTRSAISGLVSRIRGDLARVADTAIKARNRDGGMPMGWWRPGLRKRGLG